MEVGDPVGCGGGGAREINGSRGKIRMLPSARSRRQLLSVSLSWMDSVPLWKARPPRPPHNAKVEGSKPRLDMKQLTNHSSSFRLMRY